MSNLARRFYPSDSVFPLRTSFDYNEVATLIRDVTASIISKLEQYSFQSRITRHGWVAQALRDGSVPYEAFFEVFDELYRTKVSSIAVAIACSSCAYHPYTRCRLGIQTRQQPSWQPKVFLCVNFGSTTLWRIGRAQCLQRSLCQLMSSWSVFSWSLAASADPCLPRLLQTGMLPASIHQQRTQRPGYSTCSNHCGVCFEGLALL